MVKMFKTFATNRKTDESEELALARTGGGDEPHIVLYAVLIYCTYRSSPLWAVQASWYAFQD
jgi:hypothetical protein